MNKYAVWGNPIKQSLSPKIHQAFAAQFSKTIKYSKINTSQACFKHQILDFFKIHKAKGANITSPFKELAFDIAEHHSEHCLMAQACNTLTLLEDGSIQAENTDGIGFLNDLEHLGWRHDNQNILILGAGGATKGILFPLLQKQNRITIYNRTTEKAVRLSHYFATFGKIDVITIDELKKLPKHNFDLIINTTSAGLHKEYVKVPTHLLENCYIYDMQYAANMETPFLKYIRQYNAKAYQDGLGMLVAQAAHSFSIWEKKTPLISPVLHQLRREIDNKNK